jgi:hypothetical protein
VSSRTRERRGRRPTSELGRVVVRGPKDPAAAEALKRAIVKDLATLAVEMLAKGKLPPAEHAAPGAPRTSRRPKSGA